MSVMIFIPARMAANRLPGKPLMEINGIPMIVQAMKRAQEADCANVVIAAGDQEIVDCIHDYQGTAILTDPELPSGTDRIWQALQRSKRDHIDYIMNLQGDLPNIAAETIKNAFITARNSGADITTPVAPMDCPEEIANENIVKAALLFENGQKNCRALYFSRTPIPFNAPIFYHHVGLYVFTHKALARFITLPQTLLEKTERLEQLRALQDGMHIEAFLTHQIPLGVDTAEDLEAIRKLMQ